VAETKPKTVAKTSTKSTTKTSAKSKTATKPTAKAKAKSEPTPATEAEPQTEAEATTEAAARAEPKAGATTAAKARAKTANKAKTTTETTAKAKTTTRAKAGAEPATDQASPTEPNQVTASDSEAEAGPMTVLFQAPQTQVLPKRPPADEAPKDTPAAEDGDDAHGSRRRRGSRGGRKRSEGQAQESGEGETPAGQDQAKTSGSKGHGPGQAKKETAKKKKDPAKTSGKAEPKASEAAASAPGADTPDDGLEDESGTRRRRRRRRTGGEDGDSDKVTALEGSTRLAAKRMRRKEDRLTGRRRTIITEAEFLARREAVARRMMVRQLDGRIQIAVMEDGVLVEHYVTGQSGSTIAGNVYVGRVQTVLASMEAAFVDIGKGRNAVLYAGEVNWDAAGLEGQPKRIEQALKSGDVVMVQVTKDPIGHKGARLTSQITLPGRYLVFVPGGGMTGISRRLAAGERARLKQILKDIVPPDSGVIVRTAAEGASEDDLKADMARLTAAWDKINAKAKTKSASAPALLRGEPDLAIRVVRDVFNDDFEDMTVSGEKVFAEITGYIEEVAPELRQRVSLWTKEGDLFAEHRIDEQLAKGLDRKVWLPSGGSLVIDDTEAMSVIDVNTGKFTGTGGTLEETVTRNNLEAAEEIVRQLRLRDIGGIIVVDFVDMVLESNRDLVLRRLVEALSRDRTRHQVAEVTSLGLVQMTRKRVGQGLLDVFSEPCDCCNGRGVQINSTPLTKGKGGDSGGAAKRKKRGGKRQKAAAKTADSGTVPQATEEVKATLASIAAAAAHSRETS